MLKVPDQHKPWLARMLQLSDHAVDQLLARLETYRGKKSSKDDTSSEGVVEGATPVEVRSMLNTLSTLYMVRGDGDIPVEAFAVDLCKALETDRDERHRIPAGEFDRSVAKLVRLLGHERLYSAAKAVHLQRDHERSFCSARILTDMRPVFGSDAGAEPVGAVVSHVLKLGYHDQGRHRSVYIALNGDDLEELKEVVEKAQGKAEGLRSFMKRTGVRRLSGA